MIKQVKRVGRVPGLLLAALSLSGCTLGIGQGGGNLSGSFEAPVGYRQAYKSALEQTRLCLLSEGAYRVEGRVDDVAHGGRLSVVPKLLEGTEVARIELSAVGEARTRVRVDMWGESPWDAAAMKAMHDAVYFSVSSCTAYMPAFGGTPPDAWFRKK